jgi:hypothetical protein
MGRVVADRWESGIWGYALCAPDVADHVRARCLVVGQLFVFGTSGPAILLAIYTTEPWSRTLERNDVDYPLEAMVMFIYLRLSFQLAPSIQACKRCVLEVSILDMLVAGRLVKCFLWNAGYGLMA